MAIRDWNGDGKKDIVDNMIEYEIYKNVTGENDNDNIKDTDSEYEREYKTYRKIYENEAKASRGVSAGTPDNSSAGDTWGSLKLAFIIFAVCGIGIFLLNMCNSEEYRRHKMYNEALEYLEEGDYRNAEIYFTALKNYRDGKELYKYAEYMYSKESGNEDAYKYIKDIPDDYDGMYADEIKQARSEDKQAYEQYLAEKEKEKQEYEASLKTELPSAGMSTYYISDTKIGKYDSVKEEYSNELKDDVTVYRWYSDDGKCIVFAAECYSGHVRRAYKMNEDIYWIGNTPNFGAAYPAPVTSKAPSKRKEYPDDPYDVYDYSFPEDFYDDHYDDFWDYYDAEDYFNAAWDKVK